MDELDLIRSFRKNEALPNPAARVAARERLLAHMGEDCRAGLDPVAVDRSARRLCRSTTHELVIAVVGLVAGDLKRLTPEGHWLEHCSRFYDSVTESVVAGAAGNVVKHLGDGLMIAYTTDRATQAVIDAISIQEALQEDIGALLPLHCSVGIAFGEVLESRWCARGPDYLGAAVDRAAGLSAAAAAHAILIDTATVARARMDRVESRLGKVLGRSSAEYRGEPRTASLLTFDSRTTFHELHWAQTPFGLASDVMTHSAVPAERVEGSTHDKDIVTSSDDDSKDLVAVGLASPASRPLARRAVAASRNAAHGPHARNIQTELASLVNAARSGDHLAWSRLVGRFDQMLRSVARSYRLSPQDVDEAVQATWVQLYEHLDSVRDTSATAAWLATTVRRQSLHILQRRVREHLTDEPELISSERGLTPDDTLLDGERRHVLTGALSTLPDRQRRLMTLIVSDTLPDYEQIGAKLGMPIGSIGPTHARRMARLQARSELREYLRQGVALDAPR